MTVLFTYLIRAKLYFKSMMANKITSTMYKKYVLILTVVNRVQNQAQTYNNIINYFCSYSLHLAADN